MRTIRALVVDCCDFAFAFCRRGVGERRPAGNGRRPPRGRDLVETTPRVDERPGQKGNVDLLFIGDSITHGWEGGGKEVWKKYYGKRNAVNLGIGGDRTQHVLWRLDHGNIDGISPKLAVIMIGTNNAGGNRRRGDRRRGQGDRGKTRGRNCRKRKC